MPYFENQASHWDQLEAFTRENAGLFQREQLSRQTSLVDDLDLVGLDANEFMTRWFEAFQIEAGDFEFSRYFPGEKFDLIGIAFSAIATLFSKQYKKNRQTHQLTLGMLEIAMRIKRWDTTLMESRFNG